MAVYLLKPLHQVIIRWRKPIESIFLVVELLLVAFICWGAWLFVQQDPLRFRLYGWGVQAGVISLVLYLTTLVPGIMQRMGWAPRAAALLVPLRRHVGILMFLTTYLHYAFVVMLPAVIEGRPIQTTALLAFGFLAFLVLFPLWLTSNDWSQRRLGRRWKQLHRLTYVALLLIFGHVAVQLSGWALPVAVMLGLELTSWIVAIRKQRQKAVVAKKSEV